MSVFLSAKTFFFLQYNWKIFFSHENKQTNSSEIIFILVKYIFHSNQAGIGALIQVMQRVRVWWNMKSPSGIKAKINWNLQQNLGLHVPELPHILTGQIVPCFPNTMLVFYKCCTASILENLIHPSEQLIHLWTL